MWGVWECLACSRPRSCPWAGIFVRFFNVLSLVCRWHFGTKCHLQNSGALSLVLLGVVLPENVKIIVPKSSWKYFSDVVYAVLSVDGYLFWNLVNLVSKALIHPENSLKSFPFKKKSLCALNVGGVPAYLWKLLGLLEFFWRTWQFCKLYLNITRNIK